MMTASSRAGCEAHTTWCSASGPEPPTRTSPPPSDEGVNNQRCSDTWGNLMEKKQTHTTVRIAFQNIGGFLQEEEREIKLEGLRHMVTERQIDILGFTEPNTCWDLLPDTLRPAKYTRGWWETSQWNLTYNWTEKNRTTYQLGGAGILCVNQVAHRTLCPGDDPSGLGRWCWTRI